MAGVEMVFQPSVIDTQQGLCVCPMKYYKGQFRSGGGGIWSQVKSFREGVSINDVTFGLLNLPNPPSPPPIMLDTFCLNRSPPNWQ